MEKQGPSQANQSEKQDGNKGRVPVEPNLRQDISHLDQQEGHMNNGRLGGNFEETTDEHLEKQ